MVRNQDSHATILEARNNRLDVGHCNRVDTSERFVEQKERRVAREGARDFETATFAARAAHGLGLANVRNLKFFEKFFEAPLALGALHVLRLENGHDVVFDRKLAENRSFLRKVSNTQARTLVHGLVGHLDIIQEDVSRLRAHHADNHVEGGRLSGTVWSKEPDDLALRHANRHVAYNLATSVHLSQVLCAYGTH